MNKIKFLILFTLIFLLNSCKAELDSFNEIKDERHIKNYKTYTINRKDILSDFQLFNQIAKVQNNFTQKIQHSRAIQDSLLEGGIIVINKVLVVEDNDEKTYTFPIHRLFKNKMI